MRPEVVNILHDLGEIDYWTMGPDPIYGDLTCPPSIVWRYRDPSTQVAEFLRHAIGSYPGAIQWDFSDAARNWVLMPKRIKESASYEELGGLGVAEELMTSDPDFGRRANAELDLLVEHIRRHMLSAPTPSRTS